MNIQLIQDFLLCCLLVNYGIITVWFLVFRFAHGWLFRLHGRWFHLSEERFDALHYGGMTIYKIGVLLLNLVPFLALHLINTSSVNSALMPGL